MRCFVLVAAGIEALMWLGAVIWVAQMPPPKFDLSGLHVFFIFCVLPALVLGLINRYLRMPSAWCWSPPSSSCRWRSRARFPTEQ
jgi:hypothetical protein